ncbi:hypothetical protein EDC01DRAFT_630036 [Geopyxis carbonaria]|nr:hypothetical protein EDC01DRAFT_630036 [Geopyxis carbonaria]
MTYSGAYIHSNEDTNPTFAPNPSYYRNEYQPNPPIFTQQEIYGFEPAQENIEMSMMEPEQIYLDMDMGWGNQSEIKQNTHQSIYYGNQPVYSEAPNMGYNPQFYTDSCQASPFTISQQSDHSFINHSHPVSPVTPTASPLNQNTYGFNQAAPSTFLLVPTINNGQFQHFNALHVPTGSNISSRSYISASDVSDTNMPFSLSKYTDISSISQPEPPALDASEEDPSNILPHSGNTELRGMGLYDDTPELMHTEFDRYSPVLPCDQIRSAPGKGLVLEKSFGLPEEMMMKDTASGKIIKGRIGFDDEISIYEEDDEFEEDLGNINMY